jgi:acyl dehydratase
MSSKLPTAPVALAEGDELPRTAIGPITRTDIVRYAGASGDFTTVHHDDAIATSAGYPSVFAMGMLHAGALSMKLARWVGPENVRTFTVRFTGLVWPGDTLTFSGRVSRIEQSGAERLAHLELEVTRQSDDVVVRGTAVAVTA